MVLAHIQNNHFLPVSNKLKHVIIFVLIFYLFVFPLMQGLSALNGLGEFKVLRLLLEAIKNFLLLYPFFVIRKNFGLLHPLIFLPLLGFILTTIKHPLSLLLPFYSISYEDNYFYTTTLYSQNLNSFDLAFAEIKMQIVTIFSLIMYYLGFFIGPKWKPLALKFNTQSSRINTYLVIFFSLSTLYLMWFLLEHRGGIEKSLLQWEGGRDYSDDNLSWTLPFLEIPSYFLILWYVLKNNILKNPLYWIAFILVNFAVFLVIGSRSSFLIPFLILGVFYVIKHKNIPWITFGTVVFIAYISIGILGNFRYTIQTSGEIDWDIFAINSIEESVIQTSEMQEARSSSFDPVLLYHRVPQEVNLLYGKTYTAALLFFVPRTVWQEKPRGAGFYNARLILNMGGDGGVPISSTAEIFWNFWWPGIIVCFFLFGQFHKWMTAMLEAYGSFMVFLILYFITLFRLELSTTNIIAYFQMIIPLILFLYITGILRKTSKKYRYARS